MILALMRGEMNNQRLLRNVVSISILLFFLQALRVIFSVMFGIIYDQVFEGPVDAWLVVSNLLVICALLAPVLAPRNNLGRWMAIFATLTALSRIGLTINQADVRYWMSLTVLAFGGLYLASLLRISRPRFLGGIVGALVLEQLLRIAGQTYDLSLQPRWLPIQILWGTLIAALVLWLYRQGEFTEDITGGLRWVDGLALAGFLYLETSLLSLPNGLARWSDMPYSPIAPLLVGVTLLLFLPSARFQFRRYCRATIDRVGLVVFLILGLLIGYFMTGLVAAVLLLVAQAAVVGALVCVYDYPLDISRPAGGRLAMGMVVFLILNFLNAFAFTYPYTLPAMRGLGWVVYLVAGLLVGLGAAMRKSLVDEGSEPSSRSAAPTLAVIIAITLSIIFAWPSTAEPLPENGRLRVATYNIHYGYDDDWRFTLKEIAQTIRAADADIVAMQEVDTGRMTSYSVDDAYYLAQQLKMNIVYLPAVEHLTGIALLYRGPIAQTDRRLLTSLQEQTGIVRAGIDYRNQTIDAYGIWMGLTNEDTQRQIDEALQFIGDRSTVTFGGDFNAEPGSPVVETVLEAGFIDPFITLGIDPPPLTSPAIEPQSRIDYVWVRGLVPARAWVSDSLASDHRMVVVEVGLP
jgi:endonuclease/exonuclease/phosphatase family metal-dependent hydrolase